MNLLVVALGGAVGATTRYLLGRGLVALGADAPWAIAVVNVVGAGVLGFVLARFVPGSDGEARALLGLTVGVLGGFTTFSTWMADVVVLWEDGRLGAAVAVLVVPVVAGLAGVVGGLAWGRAG
ncbi:MAG: CrcB family protein [Acidimicrobiia bacterium]